MPSSGVPSPWPECGPTARVTTAIFRYLFWCSGWASFLLTDPELQLESWSHSGLNSLLILLGLWLTNVFFCPDGFRFFLLKFCGECKHYLYQRLAPNLIWPQGVSEHTAFRSQFRKLGMFVALLLFCIGFHTGIAFNDTGICSTRGEGFVVIMHYERVDSMRSTKIHEQELQRVFEPYHTKHTCRQVAKRSYRRACRRAEQHGFTWYRGCLVSAAHLGVKHAPVMPTMHIPNNVQGHRHRLRQRITCFCWNAGGLSADTWDAFQVWLEKQQIDLIALQETHWPFSSEWAQSHYWVLHSGTGQRAGGLMCLVSKKLCPEHLLSWHEPIPGRILHLRIHGHLKSIDVINIYQHVHAPDRMEKRQELWNHLSTVLDSLPKRNNVILMGDLNTSLQRRTAMVGLDTYAWKQERRRGPTHQDGHLLSNLLGIHSFSALNTWHHHLGPTYRFDDRHSRIDFICCKHHLADETSRNVQYLHDFPLNGTSGASHVPLMTSLLKVWHLDVTKQTTGWTKTQRLELSQQWLHPTETICQLQQEVVRTVASLPVTAQPLDDIHAALNSFPPTTRSPPKEYIHHAVISPFRTFQEHSSHLAALRTPTLKHLFQAWFHVLQRDRARQQMKNASRRARKTKLIKIYEAANAAERANNPFRMYQAIRTLAPKQVYQKVNIRSNNGDLLQPAQAADELQEWFSALYYADKAPTSPHEFCWPFSDFDFQKGLQNIPLAKALDPQYAPAPFWRWAAEPISEKLAEFFNTCSKDGNLPSSWSSGHICFLPKSRSRTQRPQDLRPIALLEPCGKVLMGCLSDQIHEQLWPTLRGLPQFAYVPGRGCDDALHRVSSHCREVRDLVASFQFLIHQKATGSLPGELGGGLLLSLDLSKAFDAVNRSKLYQGMFDLGVDINLIRFLQSVYHNTSFHFEHKNCYREFPTHKGIRQGCKAAPQLWTIQAALILLEVARMTNTQWMLHHSTLFADDGCFHQAVRSLSELNTLLVSLGRVLDVLEAADMKINLEKTTALLRLVGPMTNKAHNKHVKRGKNGGAWLKIPRGDGSITCIRLVKHIQYLGATISYFNFEKQTMQARLKAGDKTSQQLNRWLHTTKGFNIPQKVKVWKQCVLACFKYSLLPIGFTAVSIKLFDTACIKHLRRICRIPTHLHTDTHAEFLSRNNLPDPLELLLHQCEQAERRDAQRRSQMVDNDILHSLPPIDFENRRKVLFEEWQKLRAPRDPFAAPELDTQHECNHCHQIFVSLSALRRHQTISHGHRPGPIRTVLTSDKRAGLPTCQTCGQRFTTWTRFQYHIQFVCTHTGQDHTDPGEEVEHRLRVQEFLQYACSQQMQALAQRPDLLAYFHTRCCLCQHFCVTARGLLTHLQVAHHELFRNHEAHNNFLLGLCDISSPCPFCGVEYRQYHKCIIVRQLAMLLTRDGHEPPPGIQHDALTCRFCFKVYTTKHGLQRHLNEYHRATEDYDRVDDDVIDIRCHLHEAIQNNRCADLLQLAEVQAFLATRCVSCDRQFSRRQELTRHFKHNHSSEWHECEKRALVLDNQYKPLYGCLCQPQLHSKHICTLYLQFALLRIEHEREQEPTPTDQPPDMLLSLAEQVEPLLWNGQVKLLYKKRQVRFRLTTCCQICGMRFGSGSQLTAHLQEQHAETLQETLHLKELLQWALFMELGCFCNPSSGWGEAHHECVGLTQLAFVIQDFNWQVLIPWTFTSVELTAVLEPLLPLPVLLRVTMAMMTRNFHRLWEDTDLQRMLNHNCLICQEEIPMERLMAHLVAAHGVTDARIRYLTFQLCTVFAQLMTTGGHCEWCGAVLPCRIEGDELVEYPEEHLFNCPQVIQYSILLMMPVWSKPPLTALCWPTHEAIAAAQRQEDLKLWQFNAEPSDTFGFSVDLLAQGGLLLALDPMISEMMNHKCLLCHKLFFSSQRFYEHLHRMHNYLQMLTLMCYHRLELRCNMPCRFCGHQHHDQTCLPLLNLAVFLTNGYGIRGKRGNRCSFQDLGQLAQQRADAVAGHRQLPSEQQQTTQTRTSEEKEGQPIPFGSIDHSAELAAGQLDQTGLATRRLHQCDAPRIGVHTSLQSGERERPTSFAPNQPNLAPEQPRSPDVTETSIGAYNDANLGGPDEDPHGGCTVRRPVSGLCPVPLSGQQSRSHDAFSPLGLPASLPSTHGGSRDSDSGGLQECAADSATDVRQQRHAAVSCSPEVAGWTPSSEPRALAMDSQYEKQPGTSTAIGCVIASRHLAAHPSPIEATDADSSATGIHDSEGSVRYGIVRLFLNPSGRACAANSVIACLAWMMLLAEGFVYELWHCGFELMRNVVACNLIPIDLLRHDPFGWLLTGEWSVERFLEQQQDATELCSYLLNFTRPKFLNCLWDVRPSFVDGLDSVHLAHEKGSQFTPIKMPFIDLLADACMLQDLIFAWHDDQGLCRAITEVGFQLILSVDRHLDSESMKCQQKIECPTNQILMPRFCNANGDIAFDSFELCGIVYHLGASPNTGHYRAGLRHKGQWLLYEDGCLPERVPNLPEMVCRNSVLLWLVRVTARNARTLDTEGAAFRTIYSDRNPLLSSRW